jgi:hypothetical protein
MGTTDTQAAQASHSWPDGSWRPYHPDRSPFNWKVPSDAPTLDNGDRMVESLLELSGCDLVNKPQNCKPSNWSAWEAAEDKRKGSGWPTYWVRDSDPEFTVKCTGNSHCVLGREFRLKIPEGAVRQRTDVSGEGDRHLTIVDADGVTGLGKPNYEYDFYQFEPEVVRAGVTCSTRNMAALSLMGLGLAEKINGVTGNTNAAGFGNLAGRVRVEELAAEEIRHALAIAVPCTRNACVWPAIHKGFDPDGPCQENKPDWPAMGQLFHLRMSEEEIAGHPATGPASAWVKTILRAMATYGMYVNDNGGYGSAYFQMQSEAQVQYTCLGAPDAWLSFAEQNDWARFLGEEGDPGIRRVGKLQGEMPREDAARRKWVTDWQDVWRRLVVINPEAVPGYPGPECPRDGVEPPVG